MPKISAAPVLVAEAAVVVAGVAAGAVAVAPDPVAVAGLLPPLQSLLNCEATTDPKDEVGQYNG